MTPRPEGVPTRAGTAVGEPAGLCALVLLLAAVVSAHPLLAQAAPDSEQEAQRRPVGTMTELMTQVIYPTSNAVFYVASRPPADEAEWEELAGQALMLAESANLLMTPERAPDRNQWMEDALLLLEAGEAAFEAAKARDADALGALNDPLYQSCVTCHEHYDVQP